MNMLYYGDCLTVMQGMPLASVDLIYLDHPFNSNREYKAIYKDETGRPLPDQIAAFCDLWEMNQERERSLQGMPVLMRENGIDEHAAESWRLWLDVLRNTNPKLLAYLSYIVERLIVMRGLLRPTGSIYLHCDTAASHYLKIMMDAIFGHSNFKNELVWRRATSHNDAKRYGKISDRLLFYVKSGEYTWNGDSIREQKTPEEMTKTYSSQDAKGTYTKGNLTGAAHSVSVHSQSAQPWRTYDVFARHRVWSVPKTRTYAN